MKKLSRMALLASLGLGALGAMSASLVVVGCDNSSSDAPHDAVDSGNGGHDTGVIGNDGGSDGGSDAAPEPDCFTNPKNHFEIINACTDAAKIDKKPVLPLLQPDGSLPPLP
jgi:hypothetical protein